MFMDKAPLTHHAGHGDSAYGFSHNPVTSGLAGIALGLIIGYGASQVATAAPIGQTGMTVNADCSASVLQAQQKLVDSGLMSPLPSDATELTGRLTGVSENQLTLVVDLSRLDPLGLAKLPTKRTVELSDTTVYTRQEKLSADELKKQRQAFILAALKLGAGVAAPAAPSALRAVTISGSDLKVGDTITVQAAENILSKPSFEAISVSKTLATP